MNCKKEFTDIERKELIKAFSKWEHNLSIPNEYREHTLELTYGLPYTSSSLYAGLWCTNAPATYKGDNRLSFDGLAWSEDNKPLALFTRLNDEGNEIEDVFMVMS